MSVVAATLANGGVCPLTGERVFQAEYVKNCLALMLSCGMYDYSGEWGFVVGLPAKSGVSGAIMLVIPNVGGLALLSPRLDELGNSARGIEFSKRLAIRFGLHFLNFTNEKEKADARASSTAAANAQAAAASAASSSSAAAASSASKKLGGSSGKLASAGFESESRRAADLSALQSNAETVPLIRKPVRYKYQDLSIAFIFACAQGDLGLVRSLMASAVDMNASDYDGRTALHLASSNGHLDIVQLLVRKGCELNPVDRLGGTPLADAIREGHLHVVNFLRQHRAQLADLGDPDPAEEVEEEDGAEDAVTVDEEGESNYSAHEEGSLAQSEDEAASRFGSALASPQSNSAPVSTAVKQQLNGSMESLSLNPLPSASAASPAAAPAAAPLARAKNQHARTSVA